MSKGMRNKAMRKYISLLLFFFSGFVIIQAQDNSAASAIKTITIPAGGNSYYTIRYKEAKPDDVPQEVYDGLWEIQKEVIDNFTYDYAVMRGSKKSPYGYEATKEDYYKHGSGVCDDYSNFFILLALEKGLTENLYKINGKRRGSGHAWLEYRTAENVYIIDPTWSDDYAYGNSQTRQRFRGSPAYGREAFFITYAEDDIVFPKRNGYNHSTFTGKTEIPLWNATEGEGN
jgi:transglutaminase/protease-like cytokinesis protein 3